MADKRKSYLLEPPESLTQSALMFLRHARFRLLEDYFVKIAAAVDQPAGLHRNEPSMVSRWTRDFLPQELSARARQSSRRCRHRRQRDHATCVMAFHPDRREACSQQPPGEGSEFNANRKTGLSKLPGRHPCPLGRPAPPPWASRTILPRSTAPSSTMSPPARRDHRSSSSTASPNPGGPSAG